MSQFWQVFWADALWSGVWFLFISIPITFWVAFQRKKKLKLAAAAPPGKSNPIRRVVLMLEEDPPGPGKCPLCGKDWPLEGPVYPKPPEPAP